MSIPEAPCASTEARVNLMRHGRRGTRTASLLLLVAALAACSKPVHHLTPLPSHIPSVSSSSSVPSYLLNPDVTQDSIKSTICVSGWTDMVRPPSSYTSGLKAAQLPPGADLSAYEEDHWIPLELGGAPREPRNLWPQPIAAAKKKDTVENADHTAVCAGKMTLQAARQAMYDGWKH